MGRMHGITEEIMTSVCAYCFQKPDPTSWKSEYFDEKHYKINKSCCNKGCKIRVSHESAGSQNDFFIEELLKND